MWPPAARLAHEAPHHQRRSGCKAPYTCATTTALRQLGDSLPGDLCKLHLALTTLGHAARQLLAVWVVEQQAVALQLVRQLHGGERGTPGAIRASKALALSGMHRVQARHACAWAAAGEATTQGGRGEAGMRSRHCRTTHDDCSTPAHPRECRGRAGSTTPAPDQHRHSPCAPPSPRRWAPGCGSRWSRRRARCWRRV